MLNGGPSPTAARVRNYYVWPRVPAADCGIFAGIPHVSLEGQLITYSKWLAIACWEARVVNADAAGSPETRIIQNSNDAYGVDRSSFVR